MRQSFTAFEGWCGTRSRYWYTAAEPEAKTTTFWGSPWAWSAPARRKAIPWLLARLRGFGHPEHAPRSPAGTHTCGVVYIYTRKIASERHGSPSLSLLCGDRFEGYCNPSLSSCDVRRACMCRVERVMFFLLYTNINSPLSQDKCVQRSACGRAFEI